LAFLDVEPVVASESGRVEPAAQAADVVADEEVRAVLRDAADLAALEAARALVREDQLHGPPPMTSGARRLARTSTPASVGENTTSCDAAQRSQSAKTKRPLRQSVVVSSCPAWRWHMRQAMTPRSASSCACCTHARWCSGRIAHLAEPRVELLSRDLHALRLEVPSREVEPSRGEPGLLGAEVFAQGEEPPRARSDE